AQRFIGNDQIDRQEVQEILKDIIDADNRAGETIHRLRMLFKKGEIKNQPVAINSLVQDVLRFLNSDLINCAVKTRTELSDGMPMVLVDQVQIQQVLINLIVNACDAMSSTDAAQRNLELASVAQNGDVQVMIRDHGCGIAEGRL